jgi:uncharacterized protein (DUF736 family)
MEIGIFTLNGNHYEGTLTTLGVTAELTIEPNKHKTETNKAPDFKVFHGARETGYAYRESFESQEDRRVIDFLNVKIDDPAFNYPIYGRIYTSNTSQQLPLVWNRPKPKKA